MNHPNKETIAAMLEADREGPQCNGLQRFGPAVCRPEGMRKTKYIVKSTSQFKKDYKLALKRRLNVKLLENVVAALAMGETLPERYRDAQRLVREVSRSSSSTPAKPHSAGHEFPCPTLFPFKHHPPSVYCFSNRKNLLQSAWESSILCIVGSL